MALASIQWGQGVWSRMAPRDVLASVIQGEAGGWNAQSAVAAVMQNRQNSWGGDWSKIVTPSNFNGWNSNPSAGAYTLADQLLSGTPIQSQAGNALFFASPASNNAWWANPSNPNSIVNNGVNIGGNYFSDKMGAPSANFTGGGKTPTVAGAGSTPGQLNKGETGLSFFGDNGGDGASPSTPGGGSSGAGKAGGNSPSSWELFGVPAVKDAGSNVQSGLQSAGSDVKSGLTALGSDVKSAQQAAGWTLTGLVNDTFDNLKNLFTRGLLGFFGLILILGAALYWSRGRQ
jgi:hypothetical protein